ncbi:MAG: ferrous iron transport protein A [Fervidobacterium sp.]
MRLSEVPVGVTVEVVKLFPSEISPRLRAVGILPGVRIHVVKAAPMNNPRIYKIFNKLISLRNNEAYFVDVQIVENTPLPASFVSPGDYKVMEIRAGRIARSALERIGIVEGETLKITPDKKVVTQKGKFDIGFGKLAKIFVLPTENAENGVNI